MSRDKLLAALNLRDRKSFRQRYLAPALAAGLIEMTLPEKPNSWLQRSRLTGPFRQMWVIGFDPRRVRVSDLRMAQA